VKNGDKLLAVRACGKISTYIHFSESTSKQVDPMPDGNSFYPGGTAARKNFRTFLDNAAPYCPPGFFFNSKLPACDFMDQGRELTLPGSQRVLVGDDPYNSKCCEACKNCASPLARRDTANWKPCNGDSVIDVQNRTFAWTNAYSATGASRMEPWKSARDQFSFLRARGNQTKLSTFDTVAFRVRRRPDRFHARHRAPPLHSSCQKFGNTDYFFKLTAKATMSGSMKLWEAAQ